MSKKSEKARQRKERRARKNLELNKAKSMVDKPKAESETDETKKGQPEITPATIKVTNGSPTPTNNAQGANSHKKRNYAKPIMWLIVTIWRGIMNVVKFVDKYSGAFTAGATVAIGVLTWYYVGYSHKQWQVTQETLDVSQKSYLTIGTKEGVVARFVVPKDTKQNAELVLYFHNSGHIPAKLAWGTFGPNWVATPTGNNQQHSGILYTHPFNDMSRTLMKGPGNVNGNIGEQGSSTVVAGDSIFVAPFGEISQQDLATMQSGGIEPMMMGMFHYCDELGTDVHHQFAIGYRNAPTDELSWYIVFDNPIFFFEPTSTPERIALSPCETIAERQESEVRNTRTKSLWEQARGLF